MELSLRLSSRRYKLSQRMRMVWECALPEVAKKCRPCSNSDMRPKYCTTETRIAEYFAVLRRVKLWPTIQPFANSSVEGIVSRIACAKTYLKHNCPSGDSCTLITHLDTLAGNAKRIEKDTVGLCLRCIKENDEWEESQKCNHQ